ncbi:MAG: DUF1490 family protein [Pseudonocardiales bacterium]
MFGGFVGKAAGLVASGLVGAAAYDGVKRIARSDILHGAAVTVTSWGLRGVRAAETGAEKARLATADIVSEARERIGEQTPAPGAAAANGNAHEH